MTSADDEPPEARTKTSGPWHAPRDDIVDDPVDQLVGRTVCSGRYKIVGRVGQGGMGEVFEATQIDLDLKVALKRLKPAVDRTDEAKRLERLAKEAKTLAQVVCDNVVKPFLIEPDDGEPFLAMEFVDGPSLREWLGEEPRKSAEILDVFCAAGRGLDAAHAVGVVHRDFKPDNVLIRRSDGSVKVLDFGLAHAMTHELDPSERGAGTIGYMAPEALRQEPQSPHSDQFSWCVALWEALAGERPFETRGSTGQILERMQGKPRGRPPLWLRDILRKGLGFDPKRRWKDMAALLDAIAARRRRTRRAVLLATGAAVIAATVRVITDHEPRTCEVDTTALDRAWDRETRQQIESYPDAPAPAGPYIVRELDALVERWRGEAEARCEGSMVRVVTSAYAASSPECLNERASLLRNRLQLLTVWGQPEVYAAGPELISNLRMRGEELCIGTAPAMELVRSERDRIDSIVALAELGLTNEARSLSRDFDRSDYPSYYSAQQGWEAYASSVTEVYSGSRDGLERARTDLTHAELHAVSSDEDILLAQTLLLRARTSARLLDPNNPEAHDANALELLLRRATALVMGRISQPALHAELNETCGVVNGALNRHELALACHDRAIRIYRDLDEPVRVAKSLANAGNKHQLLDQYELAAQRYAEALSLYAEADIPPTTPILVDAHRNLGLLLLGEKDRGGLEHFDFVATHGKLDQRVEAMGLGAQLATKLELDSELLRRADLLFDHIAEHPEANAAVVDKARALACIGLIPLHDERGVSTGFELVDGENVDLPLDARARVTLELAKYLDEVGPREEFERVKAKLDRILSERERRGAR